jgi:hypothetical protein
MENDGAHRKAAGASPELARQPSWARGYHEETHSNIADPLGHSMVDLEAGTRMLDGGRCERTEPMMRLMISAYLKQTKAG